MSDLRERLAAMQLKLPAPAPGCVKPTTNREHDCRVYADELLSLVAALAERVEAMQTKLVKLEGNDEHPENRCERCGGRNVVWHADSPDWNAAIRAKGLPEFLCPLCFIEAAEHAGIKPSSWRVARPEDEMRQSQAEIIESFDYALQNFKLFEETVGERRASVLEIVERLGLRNEFDAAQARRASGTGRRP